MKKLDFTKLTEAFERSTNWTQSRSIWFHRSTIEKILEKTDLVEGGIRFSFGKYEEDTLPSDMSNEKRTSYIGKLTLVLNPENHDHKFIEFENFFWNGGSLCPPHCNGTGDSPIPENQFTSDKFLKLTQAYQKEWCLDGKQTRSIWFSRKKLESLLDKSDSKNGGIKIFFAQYEENTIPSDIGSDLKETYIGKFTLVLAASDLNQTPEEPTNFMNGGKLCPPHCIDFSKKTKSIKNSKVGVKSI